MNDHRNSQHTNVLSFGPFSLFAAERLLKNCSLSSYYDEVSLRGLQLAAEDAQRGVLHQEQLERVKNTIKELVSELAANDDREPAPGESDDGAAPPPQWPRPRRAWPRAVSAR